MRMIDLSGLRFGRWTVLRRGKNTEQGQARWLCQCECGTKRLLKSIVIRRGKSKSCGCLKSELTTQRNLERDYSLSKGNFKHGYARNKNASPTYKIWYGMIRRCTKPRGKNWDWYKGRGIKVCKRWFSFLNFLKDMGERPSPKHSIDRIDNDGNYEPGNCRWATAKEQGRNTRKNCMLTYKGKTQCISAWAEELGISPFVIHTRLYRGDSDERALRTKAFA